MSQPWESPDYTNSQLEEIQRIADEMYAKVNIKTISILTLLAFLLYFALSICDVALLCLGSPFLRPFQNTTQ